MYEITKKNGVGIPQMSMHLVYVINWKYVKRAKMIILISLQYRFIFEYVAHVAIFYCYNNKKTEVCLRL